MHDSSRNKVLLACTVLLGCFGLARATPIPPLASSSAALPSIAASSPATELLEPDEATELQSTSRSEAVLDYDAKKFLQNYGYMQTYNPSKGKWEFIDRAKTPWQDTLAPTSAPVVDKTGGAADSTEKVSPKTNDSLAMEERTKFEQAIESFQRRYKLHVSGSIDEQTLRFMQQPRCGVPDYASKFDGKVDIKKAAATSDLKGTLSATTGKSTSKAAISNDSGTLGGTLGSKSASVTSGRSTVSSPVAKVATRTQDTLSREASKASEPISLSDLLLRTVKPNADVQAGLDSTRTSSTFKTTELTEIVTEIVTVEDEELVTTTGTIPTTVLTTATTPLLSKHDLPRSRRGVHDLLRIRTKRQSYYDSLVNGSNVAIDRVRITWRILSTYYSRHFSANDLRSQITQAFRKWAEVLPVTFDERPTDDLLNVNIQIAFLDSTNSNHYNFAFSNGELARSVRTATHHDLQFNDDIQWTYNSHQGKNLIKVAVHEIAHVLGLWHSDNADSIMYPIYVPFAASENFRVTIDSESLQRAQAIHGTCSGSFDTILDWVRTVGIKRKYSSVFFRGNSVWVYENTNGRVKPGDPRSISAMWSAGLPANLDAALQIRPRSSTLDNLYFFKGNKYYQYDNVNHVVMTSDPDTNADISNGTLISEGWPAKSGFPRIPDNIDTAYYDKRDGNVYFFKGSQVYAYDRQAGGCCLNNYPMAISTAYPYRYASGGLPSNIDAAYYSIHSRKLYFFKGDTFWENETYNPSANTVVNKVGPSQQWNQHWNNICDV